jgi:hypothetical protein
VRYLDPGLKKVDGASAGMKSIGGERRTYLGIGGNRIVTENKVWYTYAESLDGTSVWRGSGSTARTRTCGGEELKMKMNTYVDKNGDLYVGFNCNPSRRELAGSVASFPAAAWEMFPNDESGSQDKVLEANETVLEFQELDFKHKHPIFLDPSRRGYKQSNAITRKMTNDG